MLVLPVVEDFCQFIDTHGLIDLGFIGHPFTWNNHRDGLANIQECIDRGFSND